MLSASTARLVEHTAVLGEPELVSIKGGDQPATAYRLLGLPDGLRLPRVRSTLVGRRWEMAAVEGLLERGIDGHGAVVTVVGSPGIGKSRLVREVTKIASARGVEVFSAFCESHATDVPFHVVARLLRATTGVHGLMARQLGCGCGLKRPTPTPKTCCCSRICWGSPIPRWSCPRSIRMPVEGG